MMGRARRTHTRHATATRGVSVHGHRRRRSLGFFAATVTSFDAQAGTFRLDYDDGDVDAAFKPWNEHVCFIRQNDSDGGDDEQNDEDDAIMERANNDLSTPPQPSRVMRTNAKCEAVEIGSVV